MSPEISPVAEPHVGRAPMDLLRFATAEVAPHAQTWHRNDELIPLDLVQKLAEMGVFGLTVPESHGGLGLGKVAMCLVSEALSGAYLGVNFVF